MFNYAVSAAEFNVSWCGKYIMKGEKVEWGGRGLF
jgi:hypothetical protein